MRSVAFVRFKFEDEAGRIIAVTAEPDEESNRLVLKNESGQVNGEIPLDRIEAWWHEAVRNGHADQIAVPTGAGSNGRNSIDVPARALEQEWLAQHQGDYAGAWVALDGASLIASGSSATQLLDAATGEGCPQPLIGHIPSRPELPFGGW